MFDLPELNILLRRAAAMSDNLHQLLPRGSPLSKNALELKQDLHEAIQEVVSDIEQQPLIRHPDTLLVDLELSTRALSTCHKMLWTTVGQVREHTDQYILAIPHCGRLTLRELREYCGGPSQC